MADEPQNKIPDLGAGDYEIKMTRDSKGQEQVKELSFKRKPDEKPMPGQYL